MEEAFRVFSVAAVEKFRRGEALTQLERAIAHEALKMSELFPDREAASELLTAMSLPPVENIRGDWMSCWEVDSSCEFMCIAMGEGDGSGHAEARFLDVFSRSVCVGHSSRFTSRSPFGDFLLLKDARVGDTIFVKDDLLDGWTMMRVHHIDEDTRTYHCRTALETSYVADSTIAATRMVSRTPPEWGGQRWSLNPFTHELCMYRDVAVTEPTLRTKNHAIARREALRHRDHMPGLWSALTFRQDHLDYVPKVPGVEYSTWTPQGSWSPSYSYTDGKIVPPRSIPSVYPHGHVVVPALFGGHSVPTGWYAAPDGIHVFITSNEVGRPGGADRVFQYRDTIEFIAPDVVLRVHDGGAAFQLEFESEESRTAFLDAYVRNAKDYFGLDVVLVNVHRGG